MLGNEKLNAQTTGFFLGKLSWVEAEKKLNELPLVIVPFGGGAKEHGLHLPMNADQVVMEYLCLEAVKALPVVVAPPILHGWFPAFRGFPGTEIADAEIFQKYVFEVANSLVKQGAKRIVFLNTGISKATGLPISIAAREIRVQTGAPTLVVSWDDLETEEVDLLQEQKIGGHGGEIETSIHLFLQPNLVRMDLATEDYGRDLRKAYPGYKPGLFSRDRSDPAYSTTGIFGDPTLATAKKGRKVLEIMTTQWLKALEGFAKEPLQN